MTTTIKLGWPKLTALKYVQFTKKTLQHLCTLIMIDNAISICARACACPTVCQLKIDRCTHHGPSGARPVADTSPSCNEFLVWHRSSFANDASSSDFAWPPPWASWRLCTPLHSRSDCPWVSRSQKWGILCPIPCEERTKPNVQYFNKNTQ